MRGIRKQPVDGRADRNSAIRISHANVEPLDRSAIDRAPLVEVREVDDAKLRGARILDRIEGTDDDERPIAAAVRAQLARSQRHRVANLPFEQLEQRGCREKSGASPLHRAQALLVRRERRSQREEAAGLGCKRGHAIRSTIVGREIGPRHDRDDAADFSDLLAHRDRHRRTASHAGVGRQELTPRLRDDAFESRVHALQQADQREGDDNRQ